MSLTLHTYPGNFRAFKALIAAEYNGVTVNVPHFRMGVDNKSAAFKAISPLGKVPVLQTSQGTVFESNAIARYVARLRMDTELMGSSFFENGEVDSWIDFCSNELEIPMGMWIFPVLGFMPNNAAVTGKAQGDLKKALMILNKHLETRTYIVGRKVTLADICLVAALYYPFKLVLDAKARKACGNVERWFTTCINQPAFKAVLGEFTFCKEVQKAPATAGDAAPAPAKKEKKKAPKAAKKEAAAPAAEEEKPKKKAAHPLSLLPKSDFVMDEWKKMYSNNDIKTVAMPWFFEKLDQEGYSVWFNEYNYNKENKMMFMTSNLVEGFMQRTEEMRKYAFGMIHIFGDEETAENFPVSGCWLFRGTSMDSMREANPDAEYHTWTRADLSDEATRAKVSAIWSANSQGGDDSNINGVVVSDWRCFK